MNPYEVLGVPEGSDEETIKKAYKELVKKYHPDKYVNNPLADLASEKLKEVNQAYDMLTKKNTSSSGTGGHTGARGGWYGYKGAYGSGNAGQANFQSVRMLINMGQCQQAVMMLGQLPHTAEWHYLMGLAYMRTGRSVEGLRYLEQAASMDPNNLEYRNTLNSVRSGNQQYRNMSPMGTGAGLCDCCSTLCVADCCCEMCGGDLVPCC